MWAIRRAAYPLRSHAYRLVTPRASYSTSEILLGDREHGLDGHKHDLVIANTCPRPKRFYCRPYVPSKYFAGTRSLSSQAGAKSSDEDDLEDGFSELETPPDAESVAEINEDVEATEELFSEPELSDDDSESAHDELDISDDEISAKEKAPPPDAESFAEINEDVEVTEESVSEPELSDDDSEGNLLESAHDELDISDDEAGAKDDKESKKKAPSSPLFKVIMDAPHQSIHSAIDKWVEEGNPLGRTESSVAMMNLRKRRMFGRALKLSEWLELNKRVDFVERDYASRLDLIAKVHGLQKAEKYIKKIPQSFQGEIIYRTLLANCVVAANVKKAEEVFNKMRDLGFPLTPFSCNQLLLLYKRVDRKKIADVLVMMEKENVKPSLFTYRLLIDAKGRSNDISGMELIVDTMKADGIEPDLLIQAMIARFYVYGGLNKKAEAVLSEMEGDNIKESRGTCKLLLPLYASLGKADEVGRIWRVCEEQRPRLDECIAGIQAWGKVGRVENAEAVFEKMFKTWKRLSSKHYTALLEVYANHKLLAKGKDLAKRMSDNGCQIGPYTVAAIVKLYLEAGEVEKADSILQKATQQSPMKPLYSSYIAVLDKYAKRGDIHNAEKIFHRLRQCGYAGRIQQYQALLQAYVNAKAPAYGFKERLKADNVFPNQTLAALLAHVDAFKKTPISELLD